MIGNGTHYYYFEGIEGDQYGTYNIIEPGQGPYNISIARTKIENLTVSVVNKFPTANFSIDKIIADVGEEIHFYFTGYEGNPPSDFRWNFGDGNFSDEENPTHTYSSEGTFTVSLLVTDYDGDSNFMAKTDIIEIKNNDSEPTLPDNPVIHGFPLVPLSVISLLFFFGLMLIEPRKKN